MNSLSLYAEMIRYFRQPEFVLRRSRLNPNDATAVLGLICLTFLTLIPISFLQALFFGLTGLMPPEPSSDYEVMMESPRFVLLAVVFAPLIEEILFRSWLGFRRGIFWILPAILLLFAALGLASEPNPSLLAVLAVLIAFIAAGFYAWSWASFKPSERVQQAALNRVFPLFFWGTALLFGAMHAANFAPGYPIWAMPIILLPLIFAGAVLGFIRMRFGLLVSILFHSGYNTLVLTISSLLMFGSV